MARNHSRSYLESLLQPPTSSGTIGSSRPAQLVRTSSGLGLSTVAAAEVNNYKPTKSSGLAVEGSADEEEAVKEIDESEINKTESEARVPASAADSISSASEDDDYDPGRFLRIQTAQSRPVQNALPTMQMVQQILNVLDDETLDDEDRIDRVRISLAGRLKDVEGSQVSPARLDNIVLSLLHRHREDVRPTGATFTLPASPSPSPFPASPRSRPRPASLRSMSGTSMSLARPWTPNLPTTPTSSIANQESGPSVPSSPLLVAQAINIGNGSPKASPSLWHRSLSNSTGIAAIANPWSNSGPHSPSTFAPLGPPGDTIGSPPKMTLSNTTKSSLLSTPGASNPHSRPSSPGNGGTDSPRLNVAAVAFKPRSSQSTGQQTTPQKPVPWLTEGGDAQLVRTTSEDSDEDEFSPFAGQGAVPVPGSSSSSVSSSLRPAGRTRPISGASGNSSIQSLTTAESVSGSYHGSTTSASLESSDDQRAHKWPGFGAEEDGENIAMTPFDVLSSILSSSNVGAASWTNEQLEEALEINNWDIDATLSAIMESGGMPGTIGGTTKIAGPAHGSGMGIPSGRSGVSLVSRDSLIGHRTATSGAPSERPTTTTTQASLQMQQGGPVGPGRVCRYFLAGECRRADCRFSHDLNRAVCRFWMKGQCLNGEGCSFLHDMSVVDKLANRVSSSMSTSVSSTERTEVETPPNEEFPELSMAPTGPKAQRGKGPGGSVLTPGSSNVADPSRTRWAQALQKRAHTPLALVQQGESHLHLHRKAGEGPAKGTPTGPRNSSISGNPAKGGSSSVTSRIPTHTPLLLPTLSTGKEASHSYTTYRERAASLSDKRNKMLARAAEAWKKGDGSEARKWSREGQNINKLLQEESRVASRSILQERHEEIQRRLLEDGQGARGLVDPSLEERGSRGIRGKMMGARMGVCLGVAPKMQSSVANTLSLSLEERMEVLLDLHSMHASEAVEIVEEFLIGLERENYRGIALLAVGLGKHTSQETDRRRVGLAIGVRNFLSSWNYPFSEYNGVIVVDPLSHL